MDNVEYAGFWIRTAAAVVDSLILMFLLVPLLTAVYGRDYWLSEALLQGPMDLLINYVLPAVAIIVFWMYKSATPGKMVTKLEIVDAETGAKPTARQCIIRYLGYYVSTIPLLLGIIWVGIDQRKQGWHDKLAGTVVIHRPDAETD